MVHTAFYLKTNNIDSFDPEMPLYNALATAILKKAQSLNFRPPHLEKACENFLFAKQYGGRIEIADFFIGEERKPLLNPQEMATAKKVHSLTNKPNNGQQPTP